MQQLYQYAMAVCGYYKNPDLFITFTFQKRGLPHVHIILWLSDNYKLKNPSMVDKTISAELLDPLLDPVGYEAVTKFMLHGPCGQASPTSPCMEEDKCSKFFSKPFASETTFGKNGYVTYSRRATNISASKTGANLDNSYYNRDLVVKYQAHINVEICHKGQLIKYLFKYITKGPDRSEVLAESRQASNIEKTMLTEWFQLNQSYPTARKYTYSDILQIFVWDKQCSQWTPRKKGFSIGRIYSITTKSGDTFYLRMLLTKIPGALSYEALHTVNGILYPDYQKAYQALGLLSTDDEWNDVMSEFSHWGMRHLIRSTFISLLMFCNIALVVASSGIAATLLPGGVTAHSRFKIPIDVDHSSTCAIKKGTTLARLIEQATLIVWDEASMVHRLSFEAVDRTLCDLMNTHTSGPGYKPFGGKIVLLRGYFRQTLPVVTNGHRGDNLSASLTRSYLWTHCKVLKLHTNMRLNRSNTNLTDLFNGMRFPEWILALGDGNLPSVTQPDYQRSDWIKILDSFVIPQSANPISSLVAHVYPNLVTSFRNISYLRNRAIVAPTNNDVSQINDYILTQLLGEPKVYLRSDTLTTPGPNQTELEIQYPTEFLNGLSFNGMPEHKLNFKPYIIVMLLRNLNPAAGLCNGTRILITHLGNNVIRGLIVGGTFDGPVAIIPRIVLDYTDPNWPFTLKRRQYPLRPCYAMTINKSQGQTLDHIGVYLPTPVFGHGQLYVALSRVRSACGIHIVLGDATTHPPNTTRNIVYHEIFEDLLLPTFVV
ncbi:ATP-dependent DNA helicase PIF1 [Linum grandiflorum]